MSWIKLKADQLFNGYQFLENKILVLLPDGTVEAIIDAEGTEENIKIPGILSPGFINCHCHMELSHMKGMIPEKTGLLDFVRQVIIKRNLDTSIIMPAIEHSIHEMLANGIVAVGDICNTTDTIALKEKKQLYYHNFIEVLGFDPAQATANFDRFKNRYDSYCAIFNKKQVSLTPHAPYSVAAPLWEKTIHFPENNLLSIHNQETPEENQWFQNKEGGFGELYKRMGLDATVFQPTGKSSLQSYLQKFASGQSVLLVHNVFTSEADIQFANQLPHHLFWCLCVNANQYISNSVPDIPLFIKNDCELVLGTDSLASNHQLNIWEEIKTIQQCFPNIPLAQLLQWATINGSRALQIDDQYGSFEKGKQPGFVIINETGAKKLSLLDPYYLS